MEEIGQHLPAQISSRDITEGPRRQSYVGYCYLGMMSFREKITEDPKLSRCGKKYLANVEILIVIQETLIEEHSNLLYWHLYF